jgi:NRAMP (natural resistance-associated macrophage protein)-like metal ion transporter
MANKPLSLRARLVRTAHHWTAGLGPGIVTGAADDDPSGIATYSQAGARFGYGLLWTLPLSYPMLAAVQLISAHIGRVTGGGLAKAFVASFPRPVVTGLVAFLLIANICNIGADLAAMGSAAELVVGGNPHLFVIAFALVSAGLQILIPYQRYANVLKWLTLSLFAYVAVIFLVHVDWPGALTGLVWPGELGTAALLTVVAILGTTISPYLFFWQSSQEAEDIAVSPTEKPLKDAPRRARTQFRKIRFDTLLGMAFSHLIAVAIMVATAATLHVQGITDVGSAADAASALRPLAGKFASALFALGIIGTGMLGVPVLAGSAAFAVAEARGWREGLEYKPREAVRFYSIIAAAMAVGVTLDWFGFNPMKALFWSAVLNGICAVPIMIAMMLVASRKEIMGRFTERRVLMTLGWATTAAMAGASALTLFQMLVG